MAPYRNREDTGINDPKCLDALDPKLGVDHFAHSSRPGGVSM